MQINSRLDGHLVQGHVGHYRYLCGNTP
jgi:riboflavin synthase alpha subunit